MKTKVTPQSKAKELAKPQVGREVYAPGAYNRLGKKGETIVFIPKKVDSIHAKKI